MQLLVIGGTQFVGRHIVEAALSRGDRVTLFNRGQTAAALPPGVQHLRGDRRGDLSALAGGRWDAVVDTCGFLPAEVARMADALQGRVGRYVFISSVSAYAGFERPNHEGSVLGRIDDPHTETVDGRTYGPLKALCEYEVQQRFGASALIVRPGLVVGPHDPTQRFTYWPARIARAADGQAVLVPGEPTQPVQFIDARDLAAFVLLGISAALQGPFNAIAPAGGLKFGEVLDVCAQVAGCRPRWVWVPADRIEAIELKPWSDLPLWVPPGGDMQAFVLTDTSGAAAAGLRIRPLAQTVADTLAWHRGLAPDQQVFTKAGLTPEREAAALASVGCLTPSPARGRGPG
jgi:2'-hydroxyisoflavone reductase